MINNKVVGPIQKQRSLDETSSDVFDSGTNLPTAVDTESNRDPIADIQPLDDKSLNSPRAHRYSLLEQSLLTHVDQILTYNDWKELTVLKGIQICTKQVDSGTMVKGITGMFLVIIINNSNRNTVCRI